MDNIVKNNTLDNIKDKLQKILDASFTEKYKRKIDVYPDRFSCACPLCGDSSSDIRKKRGNLYLNTLRYHCFNCGQNMGINSFLYKFGESLSNDDKIVVHQIQQNSKKFERRTTHSQSSMSMNLLSKLAIPKMILFKQLGIISPYKNEFASNYLKSRKINIQLWKYFAYNPKSKELYILNISDTNRVIGYQIRQLDTKSRKARYLSRSLSKIYSEVFNKDITSIVNKLLMNEKLGSKYIEEEDGIENIVAHLDRLSGIFNIMNVDFSKTLTVLEGPIDSLAMENSVALQGATKQFNGFFDEIETVRYLFDNDKAGKKMSIKKLKEHKPVFLWDMYLKKINTKEKIKDVNDLQKKEIYNSEIIESCFSDNEFDVMFI